MVLVGNPRVAAESIIRDVYIFFLNQTGLKEKKKQKWLSSLSFDNTSRTKE
ncbi:hypothetical protein HanPI659440_Chr05g0186511 [Helianthus annuus]|nr:hypothetical protein HanPI659440_Chr05g0186511 [Helianthus annuus]